MLTDDQVVTLVRKHIETKFPKTCSCCGHVYANLAEYVSTVRHLGAPTCEDAEGDDPQPEDPAGSMAFSNCPCGTTLTISSEGMSVMTLWRLLWWSKDAMRRRGMSAKQVMSDLRARIDAQVLAECSPAPERPRLRA